MELPVGLGLLPRVVCWKEYSWSVSYVRGTLFGERYEFVKSLAD
jgi:hypothetical protein